MSEILKGKKLVKIFSLFSLSLLVPAAMCQQISAPIRQVSYENAYGPGLSWPRWENGYMVSWKIETLPSGTSDNLTLYSRNGQIVGRTRVWLQGASLLRIVDAAIRPDGSIVAVGWAVAEDGTVAGFLADVVFSRSSVLVTRTSPFVGQAVTVGPDGSIWVLGFQTGPGRRVATAPDHYVVQHFGTNAIIKGQHLLRSGFSCQVHPALSGKRELPRIAASADRIGIFSPACRSWTELNLEGELTGQWKWKSGPVNKFGAETTVIRSPEFTSTNELYGLMESATASTLVRFDRTSSSWSPVAVSEPDAARACLGRLWGTDGAALVSVCDDGQTVTWREPLKSN
jgi:hypothetical protein